MRGPCAKTPAGRVDRIMALSPLKRSHPGGLGAGCGDDNALRRLRDARGGGGGHFRRMETARRMSGTCSSEATKVIKTSGDGSGPLPEPGVGSDHPGSLQPFGFLRPGNFSERPISSAQNVN